MSTHRVASADAMCLVSGVWIVYRVHRGLIGHDNV
jgi:hypothetical protein